MHFQNKFSKLNKKHKNYFQYKKVKIVFKHFKQAWNVQLNKVRINEYLILLPLFSFICGFSIQT